MSATVIVETLRRHFAHIAYIGAGESFGEMSMIDEKPRSATIVAVERTVARELHRDDFLTFFGVGFLNGIFNRFNRRFAWQHA